MVSFAHRLALLVGVLALVVGVVACGGDDGQQGAADTATAPTGEGGAASGEPLTFGLITDITKFSDFGIRTRDAVQLAVDEANEAGGVNGHPVEVVFGDSAGDPQEAAVLTRKMARDDEALAIWGPFTSGEAEVAFPIANQLSVPIIASTSAKPGVPDENRPWTFRNTATEPQVLGPALEKFVAEYDLQRVAIAYDAAEPVAKATGELVFPALAKDAGLEIVNADNPVTWQTGNTNFAPQVTRLKGTGAQALLLGTTANDAARLAQEMKRQGLDIPAIGGVSMFNESLISVGGDAVDGWFTGQVFWAGDPDVQEWVEKIRGYHEKSFPDDPTPIPDSATWYDTAKITFQCVEENEITAETPLEEARTMIRDCWQNLDGYDGISGLTSMTESGQAEKEIVVVKVENGEFTEVE